jgi:Spy/CpxP family protein refolding chaperone
MKNYIVLCLLSYSIFSHATEDLPQKSSELVFESQSKLVKLQSLQQADREHIAKIEKSLVQYKKDNLSSEALIKIKTYEKQLTKMKKDSAAFQKEVDYANQQVKKSKITYIYIKLMASYGEASNKNTEHLPMIVPTNLIPTERLISDFNVIVANDICTGIATSAKLDINISTMHITNSLNLLAPIILSLDFSEDNFSNISKNTSFWETEEDRVELIQTEYLKLQASKMLIRKAFGEGFSLGKSDFDHAKVEKVAKEMYNNLCRNLENMINVSKNLII